MLPTRLRKNKMIRALVRETRLDMDDIIYPLFITEGSGVREEIASMKGQYRLSLDELEKEVKTLRDSGIKAVILFGIPGEKDACASPASDKDGIIQRAVKTIKQCCPDLYVITDVCLCEYKTDGHCCFFDQDGGIDRSKTLDVLSETALSHARAGADMVAPSDMMDEHIAAIRAGLDTAGFEHIPVMGYSAKYASAFYGPFREAADSAPAFGDRRAYQMDPANSREALKEIQLDIDEGADIVMVKPAMAYLDIITKAKTLSNLPLAAYQVSGE